MHSLSSVFSVLSLKCMACSSIESWDKCKDLEVSMTCPAYASEQCVKLYFKTSSVESFIQMCGTDAYCDEKTNPSCKEAIGSCECDVYCCKGDDCNGGTGTRISGILLVSCALASLMIFYKA